ncbi:MAG: glycosyltransferase family 2 protein [Thermoanaerobaculales bacterium]|jgi:dolichyl-phosphate beta-glucosyltransferase|nr:glycosyltransferase family 2 protein [Thermoanaerobaculales bacterium]
MTAADDIARAAGQPELSVVIPALNEAGRLPPTLVRVGAYLAAHPDWQPAEIIVVDDGSSDGTALSAGGVAFAHGIELRVAEHPENRGKGAAVRTGFGLAAGHWVLLTDADLSAPIEELPVLARAASRGSVAVGSRAVERRLVETPQPRHRDLMGRTFNLILRTLRLTGVRDTQCGFKLFPGELARALSSVQRLDGFAFDVELLLLADAWGFGVNEVGVRWNHIEASRVMAVKHSMEMFGDTMRLWWWRALGRLAPRPKALE